MAFSIYTGGFRGKDAHRVIVSLPVDSAANGDISVGDHVFFSTAGYITKCAAGEIAIGVSTQNVAVPGSDGAATCSVDVSELSIYEAAPDAGTVTAALAMKTCDYGGSGTINIDASTDDNILIRYVNTDTNTVFYSIILQPAGVV